jgi:hypothetical protein
MAKTFKNEPVYNFISDQNTEKIEKQPPKDERQETLSISERALLPKAPKGYKINTLYVETKSRRLQLLLQPSLYDKIKDKAQREEKSVNDTINTILWTFFLEDK